MNPKNIVGKPLVVYIDGERRQIGTITNAVIRDGKLLVAAELDLSNGETTTIEGVAATGLDRVSTASEARLEYSG